MKRNTKNISLIVVAAFILTGSAKAEYAEGNAPFINTWLVIGTFDSPSTAVENTVNPTEGNTTNGKQWRYFDDRLFSRNLDDYQDLRSYYKIKRKESVAAKVIV